MSIKSSLKKIISDKDVKNYALFCDDNFKINGLNNLPIKKQTLEINKTIKFQKSDKKEFLLFNINSSQKIILIKIKRSQLSLDNEKIGAKFFEFLKSNSIIELSFFNNNIKDFSLKNKNFLDEFIHGAQLKF